MTTDLVHKLFERMLASDREGANNLIDAWTRQHSYEQAVVELVEPAVHMIGERWAEKRDISLAQAYIAAKIAQDVMEKAAALQKRQAPVPATKGPVVIGNIEDDYHALGRRLVVTFLRLAGWQVYDLGNDVLPAEFVDKAVEVNARVIGASAMMYTTAMNIKKLRQEIDRRGLTGRIQLAVGGAVFVERPELVQEVGGDGTARNAIDAPELMDQLWAKVEAVGGQR